MPCCARNKLTANFRSKLYLQTDKCSFSASLTVKYVKLLSESRARRTIWNNTQRKQYIIRFTSEMNAPTFADLIMKRSVRVFTLIWSRHNNIANFSDSFVSKARIFSGSRRSNSRDTFARLVISFLSVYKVSASVYNIYISWAGTRHSTG